jgi:ectoine hydroxylase-related dioxygenase (phytanoyl-CoA dioxygenase family)
MKSSTYNSTLKHESKVSHYGVTEFTPDGDNIAFHAEEILIKGYTIVPDVLSPELIKLAKDKLEVIYNKQVDEVGEDVLKELGDKDIARSLLVYDDFFLHSITLHPTIIGIVEGVLGKYFILREQNAIINRAKSENYQLRWHRDLIYQHFTYSKPFAVSALFCLADFNELNGGTWILPASQKTEAFPSERYILENEVCVNAAAGSVIVFDSMLYHRAGLNRSENDRIGINNMYVQPYIKQAISFPKQLDGKYSDDAFLNRFLGYDSETDDNVVSWRLRRLARNRGQNGK